MYVVVCVLSRVSHRVFGVSACVAAVSPFAYISFRVRPVRLSAFSPFRTLTFSHGTSRRDHRHADRCGDLVVPVVHSFEFCGFPRHDGAPPARRLVESRPVHRPPRFSLCSISVTSGQLNAQDAVLTPRETPVSLVQHPAPRGGMHTSP